MDSIKIDDFHAGDENLFKEIIRQYQHTLLAVVRPLVGINNAEEVVQEAWIKAFRSRTHFEGRSSIKTWLCSIALNEARMYLRRHKRQLTINISNDNEGNYLQDRFTSTGKWAQPPTSWSMDTPEELLMQDNLKDCLEKTLSSLPDHQQSIIQLRDVEGMPFDTICNELEITASNARVLLHRARSYIYRMLDKYQETGEC